MRFKDDDDAEKLMKDSGVKWTIDVCPLAHVNWRKSLNNQARIKNPLDEDLVQDYIAAMKAGDVFPRCIWAKVGPEEYVIIGGNHRGKAAEGFGETMLEVYVLDGQNRFVLDVLPRALNVFLGKGLTREEKIEQAIYFINKYSMSMEEASKLARLKPGALSEEVRARDMRSWLDKRDINVAKLNRTTIKRLGTIKNANVRLAAAKVLQDYAMSVDQLNRFIEDIKSQDTEGGQLQVVAQHLAAIKVAPPMAQHKRSARQKFLSAFGALEKALRGKTNLTQLQLTSKDDKQSIKERLRIMGKVFRILIAAP